MCSDPACLSVWNAWSHTEKGTHIPEPISPSIAKSTDIVPDTETIDNHVPAHPVDLTAFSHDGMDERGPPISPIESQSLTLRLTVTTSSRIIALQVSILEDVSAEG